jgi:hypothetical protein
VVTSVQPAKVVRETLQSPNPLAEVSRLAREALYNPTTTPMQPNRLVREVLHRGSGLALVQPTRMVREVLFATATRRRQIIVNTN